MLIVDSFANLCDPSFQSITLSRIYHAEDIGFIHECKPWKVRKKTDFGTESKKKCGFIFKDSCGKYNLEQFTYSCLVKMFPTASLLLQLEDSIQ